MPFDNPDTIQLTYSAGESSGLLHLCHAAHDNPTIGGMAVARKKLYVQGEAFLPAETSHGTGLLVGAGVTCLPDSSGLHRVVLKCRVLRGAYSYVSIKQATRSSALDDDDAHV
ncbi:hypothetical protein BP5796_02402 [Coleophoma crateriformis]|uniref:Uncharacterized protein n=1 Tax=Coleophoma crateriformis TaxID=565419 RepID=A0A3D8SY28_9HELO|nr:hypothetical protein BP5796_02402 [Coleophoma crateriformis]